MIGARIGAGREADVHAWSGDAVVKLYRPGFGGHRAEARALAALDGHGVAPRLIGVVDCDGRTGLVLERLDGADMLTLLQRQPFVLSLSKDGGRCGSTSSPRTAGVASGRTAVALVCAWGVFCISTIVTAGTAIANHSHLNGASTISG